MERRFSVEAEIEILKHEVSVLKAMCVDMRKTMKEQDKIKEKERERRNELARETKTKESQDSEECDKSPVDGGWHSWVRKTGFTKHAASWWEECKFCGEEKINSRYSLG